MTPEEKRAYSRGYAAQRRDIAAIKSAAYAEVEELRRGLAKMLADMRLGVCADCKHWERHGDTTKWGYCKMPPTFPLPWAGVGARDWEKRDEKSYDIVTSEGFGCIRWLPKQ